MRQFINKILNLGLDHETDLIERRRTRLINRFCLIIISFVFIFSFGNMLAGQVLYGLFVLMCIPISMLPTLYLNYRNQTLWARRYFIISAYILMTSLSFLAVYHHENQGNEIFILGFSILVIVLFDNPWKISMLILFMLSTMALKSYRVFQQGLAFDHNLYLAQVNILIAYISVYFFTSMFKTDLIENMAALRKSFKTLDDHKRQILEQHDELEAKRRQLNTLFDHVPIYLAMFDLEGRYTLFNSWYLEAFPNETKESLLGKRYDEAMNPELAKISRYPINESIKGNEVKFNREIPMPNGDNIHIFGKYIPVFDEKNTVKEILVYAIDITKLVRTEKKLKESNAIKDQLFSIISHDLRSPISSLNTLLNLPQQLEQKQFEEFIVQIRSQIGAVSFTMENLLSWVQTQFENFKIYPLEVPIAELADHCIGLYQNQLKDKYITIKNNLPRNETVFVDQDNLSLVIRNLINNALKFTPQNGEISLTFEQNEQEKIIIVQDTGVGMSRENIDELLNNSRIRASSKGTQGERGSGLGLGFCQDILSLNNAKMELESEIGKGTRVRLVFAL